MYVYEGKTKLFDHNYAKELSTLIHQSYEQGSRSSYVTTFSYKLEKFLNQNRISDIFDTINSIFSLIISIFYIIATYTHPELTETQKKTNYYLNVIETIFLVYFIIHYVLRLYCSQNRILFILDLLNIADIASCICLILSKQEFAYSTDAGYFLRGFRMIRILYLFQMEYVLQRRTNEQIRYLYVLAVTLIAIIFISVTVILELENNYERNNSRDSNISLYKFHDILYFIAVTLTTIGFGDITPQSDTGRFAVIITVGIVIAVLPALYSKISIVFSLNSKYSRTKYTKSSKTPKHLVLVGDCGPESFDACLQELYHEDHANVDFDTVILQIEENEEMLKIYQRKSYENNIYYLVGNVMNHQDLIRARTDNCICVIILANKLSTNHRQEDFNNIMKAFSILKYSNMVRAELKARVCIQLILPETKEIYYNSLIHKNEHDKGPQIICLEEIKLQLLGKSCQCQGINAIIALLTTSQKPNLNDIREIPFFQDWMNEYLQGLENEIYCIKIKCEYLHNLTFNDLVKIIYELTDFIVIGTDVIYQELKPFVCLNPYNYIFSPFDHLIYLLASSQPNENEINDLLEKYLENHKKGIVENNIEMVKVKRLKKSYWANLGRDFQSKNKGGGDEEEENKIMFGQMNKYLNNDLNNIHINKKEEPEIHDLLYMNENINKNQDPRIYNKYAFVSTLRPRTQHESEYFSDELLDHHIIICGVNPNLKHLILPLRTRCKEKHNSILIMDKNEHLSSDIWKEIQYFPNIYYMQGNPIKSDDLKKARVSKALAVVILSKYNQGEQLLEMVDADSIFIYKAIKNENSNTLIIADLISSNSIGYINNTGGENMDNFGFWLNEAFASGELYISSMLDTLICQSFYNPYILNIIYQLMLGESAFKFPEQTLNRLNKFKLIKSSLNLYKINDLLEKYKYNQDMNNSKISFKVLFEFLVEKNMIPIGVLRTNALNNQRFVYLAPAREVMINIEKDEIYVICSEEGQDLEEQKKNFEQYNMTLIEKSNTAFNEMSDFAKKSVDEIINNLRNEFSMKNIIDITRNSLRNQLVLTYQRKEEEVYKQAKEEFNRLNFEIKEDSGEIEIDESESKYSNNSKSS